jgi:hypothetical protein
MLLNDELKLVCQSAEFVLVLPLLREYLLVGIQTVLIYEGLKGCTYI